MVRSLEHVREGEARPEIAALFVDIRRCLRTTYVPLLFRTLAAHPGVLKPVWQAMRANVLTRAFEEAANDLRSHIATAAVELGTPLIEPVLASEGFDTDTLDELRDEVQVFHYTDPKVLLCTAMLSEALAGRAVGGTRRVHPALRVAFEPGAPADMPELAPIPEEPGGIVGEIFDEILKTTHLPVATNDLRVLGRWPTFLDVGWREVGRRVFAHRALETVLEGTRAEALEAVQRLPHAFAPTISLEPRELAAVERAVAILLDATPRLALFASALQVSLDGAEDALETPYPVTWDEQQGDTLEA